jgi:hypothetical protein
VLEVKARLVFPLTLVGAALGLPVREARAEDRVAVCADAAERGQELRDARKLVEARPELVTCAQRECPSAIREPCNEWLADLDRRTPSIVVGAKDQEGRDIGAVRVTLDGAPLPATVTSAAHRINPGPHTLRAEAEGFEASSEEIMVREGEPVRVVSMTLKRTEIADASPVRPAPPVTTNAARFPVVPVVLAATSVVALGVFAYAGATGASDYRSLERTCAPDCARVEADGVRARFFVADVALVVAIASGVAAAALWIFDRPATRTARR